MSKVISLVTLLLALVFTLGPTPDTILSTGVRGTAIQPVFFCGELGANTDEFFAGPRLQALMDGAVPTSHVFATALCNTLGNTTLATVDNDIDEFWGYAVHGMHCEVSAAPGAAVTVMTFYDDTVATGVTCTVAAAETTCATDSVAEVAANSQVAVGSLNATDDESLQDIHCTVYISWNRS